MKKLLLTSVFGPFGVDDEFGRKENIMELFHNQVTREQGVFSPRLNHPSFGLYLMAENVSLPTVVLDFPSQERFIQEIKKGYDYIGISFIVPNFLKAKKMAELIREHAPKTEIILGGHGTSIKNLDTLISCDHLCRGDGIHFLRNLLGENVKAKINHPMLLSAFNQRFLGAPGSKNAGIIMTGVGCVNACRFCCTTHYFDKKYTPFINTGKELFDLCEKMEEKHGVNEFFIMDENFLKYEERAKELLALMEEHNKAYSFSIFSSAEVVTKLGVKFMERLGVNFIWIGVESKKEVFEKNKGVDFNVLVKELRDHGISVLASGILFLEEHTKETIHDDINFLVGMNSDFVQFMQLGPLPGTKLYEEYEKTNRLRKEIPYEEWHGQKRLWFSHPHFTPEESEEYHKNAFLKDMEMNGPSLLRVLDTAIRGVLSLQEKSANNFLQKRYEQRVDRAKEFYPLLSAMTLHAPNLYAKELAKRVKVKYQAIRSSIGVVDHVKSVAVQALIIKEKVRCAIVPNNMRQPSLMVTPHRMTLAKFRDACFTGKNVTGEYNILRIRLTSGHLPIQVSLSGMLDTENIQTLQNSMKKFLKREDQPIIFNLENLQKVEEEALRRFLKEIENYRHQFHLIYSRNVESTRIAIDNLVQEFDRLRFVAV